MLIFKPIGEGVARYYLGQGPGEWIGRGSGRLRLEGEVSSAALTAVLRGCDPSTGAYLPRVRSSRRRAGWDLVFAAPKSLSLMWATDENGRTAISTAHRQAVAGTIEHLQRESGKDIVAAAFGHVSNAGGEPHVHSHVLVANLAPTSGGWAALGAWLHQEELAALYHLGLRHHLELGGLHLDWRIRPGGLPDVAAVPRAAVRAASTRSHESRIGVGWSRRDGPPRDWAGPAASAGWSRREAGLVSGSRRGAVTHAESLETRVASRLLTQGSTFTKRDVVAALAATSPVGFESEAASSWTEAFCAAATPVSSTAGVARWTTPAAIDADRRLAELMSRRAGRHMFAIRDDPTSPAAPISDPTLSTQTLAAATMLLGNEALIVLAAERGSSNFVADATLLCACASVWQASGKQVSVATRNLMDAARWQALSGVEAFQPSRRPDVLLVDQAERRPPGELMALLSAAPDAKVVLVEGGTLPRARVGASLGYDRLASEVTRLDPGPEPAWRVSGQDAGASLSTGAAVGKLMSRWAEGIGLVGRDDPIMVGLGVPEALALNAGARRHLLEAGRLTGPSMSAYGRSFQAGDRVVAIRAAGAGLPCGTIGSVLEVDTKTNSVLITWPDRATQARRDSLRNIGHAYAATPRLASRMEGPVLVLGRSEGLGLERSRVAAEISVERMAPAINRERGRTRQLEGLMQGI